MATVTIHNYYGQGQDWVGTCKTILGDADAYFYLLRGHGDWVVGCGSWK